VLVVNTLSETLSSLDPDTGEMTVQAAVAGTWVNRISRDGPYLLVTSSGANRVDRLAAVDLSPAGEVDLGPGSNPWATVPIPDGRALTTSWLAGNVRITDPGAGTAGTALATTPGPEGMAVAGGLAWIACTNWQGTDFGEGRVDVVDLAAWEIVASIPVARNPQDVLVDADGRIHVLCTGTYGGGAAPEPGRVQVLDAAARAVVAEVPLGGAPGRFVEAPDGTVWVSGFEGGIRRYRADTLEMLPDPADPVLAAPGFTGIAIDPATGTAYVASFDSDLLIAIDGTTVEISGAWTVGDGPVDVLAYRPEAGS
jgi:DNA-binding beta-propeller fold protein YncE